MRDPRRGMLIGAVALATLAWCGAGTAWGAVRYAAPAGDGAPPCAQADPCSLDDAVAVPGDTAMTEVSLAAGTYARTTSLDVTSPRDIHGPPPGGGVARLDLSFPAPAPGVNVQVPDAVLRDLTIDGHNVNGAVASQGGGHFERLRVTVTGLSASAMTLREGAVVRDSTAINQDGSGIMVVPAGVGVGSIDLVNVTAQGGNHGLLVTPTTDGATVRVVNAIVRNRTVLTDDVRVLTPTGPGDIELDMSYSSVATLDCEAGATCTSGPGMQAAAPLLDAAWRQVDGSPTIDAGTASPVAGLGAFDVDGDPRVHGAAVDIGADEVAPPPPPPAAGGGGGGDGGAVVVSAPPDAAPAAPVPLAPPVPDGQLPAPADRDATAPRIRRLGLSRTPFRRARPPVLRLTLDEAATVRVVLRRCQRRRAKPCARRAKVGSALAVRGRAGRRTAVSLPRGLRPGRYRATVTARDAAGNRSAKRRIAFRVLRGGG